MNLITNYQKQKLKELSFYHDIGNIEDISYESAEKLIKKAEASKEKFKAGNREMRRSWDGK